MTNTIALPEAIFKRLEKLSASSKRSPASIVKQAVQDRLDYEEWALKQIDAAKEVGAFWVELHTGTYADADNPADAARLFMELVSAAQHARSLGLRVKCGHGLNYRNVKRFQGYAEFEEFSIGHSIIARAVLVGLERAVREMVELVTW